jgi:hypothetical protein
MTSGFLLFGAIFVIFMRLKALEANRERNRWNAPPPEKYRDYSKGASQRCAEMARLMKLVEAETPYSPEWKRLRLQMSLLYGN